MAISVETINKLQKSKENAKFSKEELVAIATLEKYIDKEIVKNSKDNEIYIFLYYANFVTALKSNKKTAFVEYRREKMHNELVKRFKKVGWRISYKYGEDGLAGAVDYMVLTKK